MTEDNDTAPADGESWTNPLSILTCLLGDKITDRVICVASAMYVFARIHLDDLNWHTREYSMWAAYAESKLATMLFINELARRGVRAYVSDPDGADSDITRDGPGWMHWRMSEHVGRYVLQSLPNAARSSIQAVTTDLPSGTYLAPRFNQWGKPTVTTPRKKARDPAMARRLWELSVDLTGCDWQGPGPQRVV